MNTAVGNPGKFIMSPAADGFDLAARTA